MLARGVAGSTGGARYGLYSLEVVEIAFSDKALSGPDQAIQVKTLRRLVPGTEEEYRIGMQATCLFPYTEAGREELLTQLAAIFPLSVPVADEGQTSGSAGRDGSSQLQGDGDDPVPCTDTDGDGVFECPEITVTVDQETGCAEGFSYDEWEGECVEDEGGGTGDPGTGSGGGNSGGGGDPPPPPECTEDQLAIAAEYRTHGFNAEEWPCTIFTHGVTHGDGTDGHTSGFLTDGFLTGSVSVESAVSGARVNSDWRCPVGNAVIPNSSPKSQHVLGTAGDFDAPDFDLARWEKFREAARAAGASNWSKYPDTPECAASPSGWCYSTYIHIDWR